MRGHASLSYSLSLLRDLESLSELRVTSSVNGVLITPPHQDIMEVEGAVGPSRPEAASSGAHNKQIQAGQILESPRKSVV